MAKRDYKTGAIYAAVALGVAGVGVAIAIHPQPRDLSPGASFSAPPYMRPDGCPIRDWQSGDDLPRSCHTPAAQIDDPQRYRLGQAYRGYHWVRAGDTALRVWCPHLGLGPCHVYDVVRGRFRPG